MPRTVKDPEERKAELLDTATRTVTKETMFTIENQKALFSFG